LNIKTIIKQLKRYPKILIAIVVIGVLLYLFGFINIDVDDQGNISAGLSGEQHEDEQVLLVEGSQQADAEQDEGQEIVVGQTSNDQQQQENQNTQSQTDGYTGPVLEDLDYDNMDLFDDGFQVVTLDHCTDGDTAQFILNGREYKSRFLAVDTPEKHEDHREKEPWGEASSEFTYHLLTNASQIIVESDPDSDELDKYGRLLAWIWVDGKLLNYMLVDASLAEVAYLYGDYKYTDQLLRVQSERKKEGNKIWGEMDPNFDY